MRTLNKRRNKMSNEKLKSMKEMMWDQYPETAPNKRRKAIFAKCAKLYNPRSEVYNGFNLAQIFDVNYDALDYYLRVVAKVRTPDMKGFLTYLGKTSFEDHKELKFAHLRFMVKREKYMNKKWYIKHCKELGPLILGMAVF